jgi:hypothetical protein
LACDEHRTTGGVPADLPALQDPAVVHDDRQHHRPVRRVRVDVQLLHTAPTGTTNAAIMARVSTAISVASGGASFTNGMYLLLDTGQNAEVVRVTGTPAATSVPVPVFARSHSSAVTYGQLQISSTYSGVGQAQVPAAAPYGF